jgi:hypothetical protein
MSTAAMKKPSKKANRKLTDAKFNQERPAGSVTLNFEAGATLPEQIEEPTKVTSKIIPIKSEESREQTEAKPKAKAPKAAPESAPVATSEFSLDVFLRDNLVAHEGHPKVTTLDIVEKYAAAAKAAGKSAQPKFTVQRMLRALMDKNFPSAVYSNSTPNGFKDVVWKSFLEESAAKRAETAARSLTVSKDMLTQLKSH